MRFFTLFATVFTIVISVNAGLTERRKTLSNFEICNNHITETTKKIELIKKEADRSSDFGSFHHAIRFLYAAGEFSTFQDSATYCCEQFAQKINSEEANLILATLSPAIDAYDSLLSTFITKKSIFEKDLYKAYETKTNIDDANNSIHKLLNCLISKPSANPTPTETTLFDKFNNANSKIKAVYDTSSEIGNTIP